MAEAALSTTFRHSVNASNNCLIPPTDGAEQDGTGMEGRIILGVFLILLIVLTLAGNALVVVSVVVYRQLHSVTNAFVVSLAIADGLVAVLVMPVNFYQQMTNFTWFLGPTACLLTISLDVMLTTTSILHLMCLAVDRYLAICHPFKYPRLMHKRKVICLLITFWTLPILISFLPIMNRWNIIGIEQVVDCLAPPDGKVCMFLVNVPFAVVCSIIAFYGPTVFMFLCNLRIYQTARAQASQIRSLSIKSPGAIRANKNMKHETKAAKTIGIIMGAYCSCWFPFFIINLIDPFIGYQVPFIPWQLVLWLGYVNSTLNPFLYYFFNRSFRRAYRRLLTCGQYRGVRDFGESHRTTSLSAISE